jgi:hypothetical protein
VKRLALGLTLVAFLIAACVSSASTATPSRSTASANPTAPATSTTPARSTTPSTASSGAGSVAGQTDTAWGRIWDTLPAGFPAVHGSTPADAAGPASANLVVDGNAAKAIATAMKAALERAGLRTAGLSGPLEDGSYVLDSVGKQAGCMVQVTASPLGGMTTVTVMYGAACPHD